ncbi:hypothetical protein PG991_010233 [Apiospora marii]|uniref:Uncharacterized protein n=1 Tax=Apiospora marii TaxID=335849 RepID=A0ABR1RI57_9PEZI
MPISGPVFEVTRQFGGSGANDAAKIDNSKQDLVCLDITSHGLAWGQDKGGSAAGALPNKYEVLMQAFSAQVVLAAATATPSAR